jgi:hypothetical protein
MEPTRDTELSAHKERPQIMPAIWIETARETLLQRRGPASGWGYRPETMPSVEPTVLACLGLLATEDDRRVGRGSAEVRDSADWLADLQGHDGSLGVSATQPTPGWTTSYGVLLWGAMGGYSAPLELATRWLLCQEGLTVPNLAPTERTVGHDTSLVGWPWVSETHSWLEPTALTILAMRRDGRANHKRVRAGLELIRDRAIASGGWNYGNNRLFERDLRPQPAPTGLALLALAGIDGRTESIERAIVYLLKTLPDTRAPQSLCWGVLALRAWRRCPKAADVWLREARERSLRRDDSPPRAAYLLLAAGVRSLEVLGLTSDRKEST